MEQTSQLMTIDLQAVRSIATNIALQAAEVIIRYHQAGTFSQKTKQNAIDIVTEADQQAEIVIVQALKAHFPDHHIIGEEGGAMGAPAEDAAYTWYIDPLDGTTNFANKIPIFGTSIALTDRDMTPIVGVVYNPISGEMFSTAKGFGTTLNGKPIHVSSAETLEQSVLCSGFPYDQATNPDNNLVEWGRFATRTRGLRRLGSAALDLCFVAAGRLDGYWEQQLNPWDYLAGQLCVLEAGGIVTDYMNRQLSATNKGRILANNGHIHQQMLDVLALR